MVKPKISLGKAMPYIVTALVLVAIILAIRNSKRIEMLRSSQQHPQPDVPAPKPMNPQNAEEMFPHPNKAKNEQSGEKAQ